MFVFKYYLHIKKWKSDFYKKRLYLSEILADKIFPKFMQKLSIIFFLIFINSFYAMSQNKLIGNVISSVEKKYAPDTRVEVFEIQAQLTDDTLSLIGKTSSKDAFSELPIVFSSHYACVQNEVILLPLKDLGEKKWGVVYNSVGTMRSNNSFAAELVSQTLLGTPVRILDMDNGWLRVQTPDRYIGWIHGSVKVMTRADLQQYNKQPKIIITSFYARSHEKCDVKSQPISDLIAGNILVLMQETDDFYRVRYPDGREGYVPKADARRVVDWLKNKLSEGDEIIETAYQFMGVPYLWGGTSTKGVDCSGFTKMVYFLHGIILARDASQQVRYGKLIDKTGDFANVLPGDLVFFGKKATPENPDERVVHVGIYIGNKRFIHASDYVHINSFDPDDTLYDAYNAGRYLRTKRILGEIDTEGIEMILKNGFYR